MTLPRSRIYCPLPAFLPPCLPPCLQKGKLWYRGGCYYAIQVLAFLIPSIVQAVVGGLVTTKGKAANELPNMTDKASQLRPGTCVLLCSSCAAARRLLRMASSCRWRCRSYQQVSG